jgi:hypothetical protein
MGASGPRKVRRDAREKLRARQHPDAGDKGEFRHLAFWAWGRPAARDPKDFPRPDGSVRKSYSSVRQKTYSQEIVAYSSKSTPDALEEFYTKSLTAAGWELNTRVENNSSVANTHQIILNWKNALRSVTITLAEVKAGGAEIGVNLITTFAP